MLPAQILANKPVVARARPAHLRAHGASPRLPSRRPRLVKASASRSVSRPPVTRVSAVLSDRLLDVGGGANGGGGMNIRKTAEDSGGNFFEHNALVDILVKGGVALSELPGDLQEALTMGLLSIKDVHLWVDIASMPVLGAACRAMPAVRDRVMGNPRFVMQLFVELVLGLTAKTVAEMKARGDKCFKEEMPFYLSDLMLEAFADIALVWLLSPKRSFKPLPSRGIARGIARLPGHSLQRGVYSASQRVMTLLYRSCQFFMVGVVTSAVGHSITKWAVEKQSGPKGDVHMAPVLDNSLGFGTFMAVSSSLRYQTVNCLEERILDAFVPPGVTNTLATFLLRFANCYGGSVQWVWFAKKAGLQ